MKAPVYRHANAASDVDVAEFQAYIRKEITRLEPSGYVIPIQDEVIFISDVPARRCGFGKTGVRSTHVVSGIH